MFTIYRSDNENGFFMPGTHSFPFSFILPSHLPGTYSGKWDGYDGRNNSAKVSYKIKAGMRNPSSNKMFYDKKKLLIDQRFDEMANYTHSLKPVLFEEHVKAYGCCSHGHFKLGAVFNEESYVSGDTANVSVAIDASEARSNVRDLMVELLMRTNIYASGHSKQFKRILSRVLLGSLKKGEVRMNEDSLNVNLAIKSGGEKKATCIGQLVRNEFEIRVVADIEGCSCCVNRPKCRQVVKVVNQHNQPPSLPMAHPAFANWQPNVHEPYACQMNEGTMINPEYYAFINGQEQ